VLDGDQVQAGLLQRSRVRREDPRPRVPVRVVGRLLGDRRQDRLREEEEATRRDDRREPRQRLGEGFVVRDVKEHVETGDEPPRGRAVAGRDEGVRSRDVGGPEASLGIALLHGGRGRRDQVDAIHGPALAHPERHPVTLADAHVEHPVTGRRPHLLAADKGPQVPRQGAVEPRIDRIGQGRLPDGAQSLALVQSPPVLIGRLGHVTPGGVPWSPATVPPRTALARLCQADANDPPESRARSSP
jgi:hypothetical protein